MIIEPTFLDGAAVITSEPFADNRGRFARLFCSDELKNYLAGKNIVNINHSLNIEAGTVRGMHFQYPPHAETKMVRCINGAVFDVIVDLRKNSNTFLKWFGIELTPEKYNMMYIPEGFAHGFQTLQPSTELLYLHTNFYEKTSEGAIRYDEPRVGVDWPLEIKGISKSDQNRSYLDLDFQGINQ